MKTKKQREIARFSLAGVQYGDYQICIGLRAGLELKMFWERSNEFDSNAIRCEWQGVKLGYIPKEHTQELHQQRQAGNKLKCFITAFNKTNPTWHMITVKIVMLEKMKSAATDIEL